MDPRKILAQVAENWPAKVLSIALALVIFVFHRMSTLEEHFFSAPLQIEIEPNIVPASLYPQMIRLSIRGEAANIRSLVENDIEAYIDLKGKGRGTYRTPVQFRKKGTALGIEPLEIRVEPLEISITLDNKISKYVPLKANIRGSLKQGYELVNTVLNPDQVILDGPSDLINSISELSTEGIELNGRSDDFSIMVAILNDNPLISIRGTGMTEFAGSIKQIIGLGNFDGLPIRVRGLSERFVADWETRTGMVRLGGNQQELENYRPPDDFLILDCSGITQTGTYTLPVLVNLAPGFSLLRQEPEKVTVFIRSKGGNL